MPDKIGSNLARVVHGSGGFPSKAPYVGFNFFRDDLGQMFYSTVRGNIGTSQWMPTIADTHRKWNFLHNGDFCINQRRSGNPTTVGPSGGKYVTDRWYVSAPAGVTFTATPYVVVTNFVVGNVDYKKNYDEISYLSLTAPANVVSAGANIGQFIEGIKSLAGKTITFSGWFIPQHATNIQTLLFRFVRRWGTGGSPSTDDSFDPIPRINLIPNVWNFVTFTYTMPNLSGGKQIGTNRDDGYEFIIYPNDAATTPIAFAISTLQIEEGSVYTRFHKREAQQELSLCQRFFQKSFDYSNLPSNGLGTYQGSTMFQIVRPTVNQFAATVQLQSRLRKATNNVTFYNPLHTAAPGKAVDVSTAGDALQTSLNFTGETAFTVYAQPAAAAVQGSIYAFHWAVACDRYD